MKTGATLSVVIHGFNDAATQADFALIEHHRLTGCNSALRFGKTDFEMILILLFDSAGLIRLTIAIFAVQFSGKLMACGSTQCICLHSRVVCSMRG